MGVVDNDNDGFPVAVQIEGFFDQALFTFKIRPLVFHIKGMTQHPDGVAIRMQGPCDIHHDGRFFRIPVDCVFYAGFSRAGFSHQQAQSALVRMDLDDIEDLLLVVQQLYAVRMEGIGVNAVKCSYQFDAPFRFNLPFATRSNLFAFPMRLFL